MNLARPPRARQTGVVNLLAVMFLITVIMTVLGITLTMNASSIMDSNQQTGSVQALLLAESGMGNAVQRFAAGTACGSLALPSTTQGNGTITINAGVGTDFSGAPLAGNRCRVAVTAQITGTQIQRVVEAIIEQGGAITYVSSNTANSGGPTASSLVIPAPSGIVANDLMLAQINVRGGTSIVTITPPAGWILLGRLNSTTVLAQAVYYRLATASEPASYTWSYSSAERTSGGIAAFRGVNTTTPIDAANGQINNALNITAPSINTTVANTMLVGLFGVARSDAITVPVTMTPAYQTATSAGGNGSTSAAAYATQAATGATGTRIATIDSFTVVENIGHLVALQPGAGGTAQILEWREVVR